MHVYLHVHAIKAYFVFTMPVIILVSGTYILEIYCILKVMFAKLLKNIYGDFSEVKHILLFIIM